MLQPPKFKSNFKKMCYILIFPTGRLKLFMMHGTLPYIHLLLEVLDLAFQGLYECDEGHSVRGARSVHRVLLQLHPGLWKQANRKVNTGSLRTLPFQRLHDTHS